MTNNWTSQLVLAQVVGDLLEDMGYNVWYVPTNTQLQFTVIANNDMDFQIEVWEGAGCLCRVLRNGRNRAQRSFYRSAFRLGKTLLRSYRRAWHEL